MLRRFQTKKTKMLFEESVALKILEQKFMFCRKNGKVLQTITISTLRNEDEITNV